MNVPDSASAVPHMTTSAAQPSLRGIGAFGFSQAIHRERSLSIPFPATHHLDGCWRKRPTHPTTGDPIMASGYFKLKKSDKDTDQPYYFVLHAGNHEAIARSEMYSSKAAAQNGIRSVQDNGPTSDVRDETGE